MTGKLLRRHQAPATVQTIVGIGPEVFRRVLVGVLRDASQGPQEIAHGFVEHHAAEVEGRRLAIEGCV